MTHRRRTPSQTTITTTYSNWKQHIPRLLLLLVVVAVHGPTTPALVSSFTTTTTTTTPNSIPKRTIVSKRRLVERHWTLPSSSFVSTPTTATAPSSITAFTNTDTARRASESDQSSSSSSSSSSDTTLSEVDELRNRAKLMRLEADRQTAQLRLEKIEKLERDLLASSSSSSSSSSSETTRPNGSRLKERRNEVKSRIEQLVRDVDPSLLPLLVQNEDEKEEEQPAEEEPISTPPITVVGTTKPPPLTTDDLKPKREPVLTAEELSSATEYYGTLPLTLQTALAKAVDLELDAVAPSLVVLALYENGEDLESDTLRSLYQQSQIDARSGSSSSSSTDQKRTALVIADGKIRVVDGITRTTNEDDDDDTKMEKEIQSVIEKLQNGASSSSSSSSSISSESFSSYTEPSMVELLLPSTVRKNDTAPTLSDLSILTNNTAVLTPKDTWRTDGPPIPIPGGFIIRGILSPNLRNRLRRSSSQKIAEGKGGGSELPGSTSGGNTLLRLIDTKIDALDPTWNDKFQVSYVYDPRTSAPSDDPNDESYYEGTDDPVLLVTNRDFSPDSNRLVGYVVTSIGFFLALVFCISTFGMNDAVMDRLSAANAATVEAARVGVGVGGEGGDLAEITDLTWFKNLVMPVLISVFTPQLLHEVAQVSVAKFHGFKVTPPTVFPLLSLPYLGFRTKIKSSPPTADAMFDYGFVGPAVGMAAAALFFVYGLKETALMTPSDIVYSPSVPVSFLQLSSLFGTAVDYVLSGGSGGVFGGGPDGSGDGLGVILSQDPNTPVPLHPFAIGGMASFLIQSLDSIPINGATDGGRMSQALLGRKEQLGLSAVVYLGLLVWVVVSGHTDIFLVYLLVTGTTQRDVADVICRNEVDKSGLGRAAAALVVWSLAILALTPIG